VRADELDVVVEPGVCLNNTIGAIGVTASITIRAQWTIAGHADAQEDEVVIVRASEELRAVLVPREVVRPGRHRDLLHGLAGVCVEHEDEVGLGGELVTGHDRAADEHEVLAEVGGATTLRHMQTNCIRLGSALLLAMTLVACSSAEGKSATTLLNEARTSVSPDLVRTQEKIQVGSHEFDRFTVHRVVRQDPLGGPLDPANTLGPVILLAGSSSNFELYDLQGDPSTLAPSLAAAGFDVYGYSPRAREIPSGYCETSAGCEFTRDWNLASYASDVLRIVDRIRIAHPTKRPVIVGGSLGAMIAYAAINQAPLRFAGAVIAEGMLYTTNEEIRSGFRDVCRESSSGARGDVLSDGQQVKALTALFKACPECENPNAPGLTNRQLLYMLMTNPVAPPQGPVPGYRMLAGDMAALKFASEDTLGAALSIFNDYDPNAVFRDYYCSLAGVETAYVRDLGNFHGPVLGVVAGHGFGVHMEENLALLGSKDVEIVREPEFGHVDFLMHRNHKLHWEQPVRDWLLRHFGSPPPPTGT
jgi:pimeloyl-ACP methyl ester carboxylesterase